MAEGLLGAELGAATRIHVGGLGAAVTGEDLERTFSSMGTVARVDLVSRPDGRRFAFLDFHPNSDKSMARLFASYNGCAWKGGKLRLEKATEHYLDRLRREWAEAREPQGDERADGGAMTKSVPAREESKSVAVEKTQLKIFFPKLRKVKSLPFKGTGKHKYSFQRVTVPSLPVNFCDCEEHARSSREVATTNRDSVNNLNGVISEKEYDVMHSVMSKIINKEEGRKGERKVDTSSPPDKDSGANHHIQLHAEEIQETDDENFVMNIGSGGARASLDSILKNRMELLPPVQDSKGKAFNRSGVSEQVHKKRKTGSDKVPELVVNENDFPFQSGGKDEFPETPSAKEARTDIPSPHSQDPIQPPSSGTKANEGPAVDKPDKGASWVQKSSWRDLVGDSNSSSFSIFSILPGRESLKRETSKSCDLTRARTNKQRDVPTKPDEVSTRAPLPDCPVHEREPTEQPEDHEEPLKDGDMARKTEVDDGNSVQDQGDGDKKTGSTGLISVSNACTFMRTADSQKQWLKAKSSMSSYLKKKSVATGKRGSTRQGS